MPLKSSCNKQRSVIVFLWAEKKLVQIRFTLRRVQYGTIFTKRTVHVWCKKMLNGLKFVLYTRVQSVVLQWHGQQPASFFASGI